MEYPQVVKILTDHYGIKRERPVWCYIQKIASGHATLCGAEYFGYGDSGTKYETKKGKITCPRCIEIIKEMKAVKL